MKKILTSIMMMIIGLPAVFAVTADVNLKLKQTALNNNSLSVAIYITNPSGQETKSVQSWLKYDPNVLKGDKINTDASPFDFVAPGENNFDDSKGIVKIGRSTLGNGNKESEILVAEVIFNVLQTKNTEISFYNFKVGNDGNTSVRVFQDGFPVNVLETAPKSLNIVFNQTIEKPDTTVINIKKPVKIEPVRPKNLRITSGPDYVVLSWDKLENMKGYNVYYSQESGRYLQRRGVGDLNEYYFDGFATGKEYYFAITAYDFNNKETDYSDEVKIRIGYPNSSTSPLAFTSSQEILSKTKQHIQSGPAEALFVILIFSSIISFLFANRKKICYNV